jgi:hypothetical protein
MQTSRIVSGKGRNRIRIGVINVLTPKPDIVPTILAKKVKSVIRMVKIII